MILKKYILFVFVLFFVYSCNYFGKNKKEDVVARVNDKYLYVSDINNIVPSGIAAEDSIAIVKNYINNWVRTQVIYQKAQENLTKEEQNFEKQLEDYRTSLVIFSFEKTLISQKLDTLVTDAQINEYYKNHENDFQLKENILQIIYAKLFKNTSHNNEIGNLIRSNNPENKDKLLKLCNQHAVKYSIEEEQWQNFNDILKEIPIKTYNQEEFLKNHKYIDMQDSLYQYFIYINGFKMKESLSPISFEKENIKNIIINIRKAKLISDMQNATYKEAIEKKLFEIY